MEQMNATDEQENTNDGAADTEVTPNDVRSRVLLRSNNSVHSIH